MLSTEEIAHHEKQLKESFSALWKHLHEAVAAKNGEGRYVFLSAFEGTSCPASVAVSFHASAFNLDASGNSVCDVFQAILNADPKKEKRERAEKLRSELATIESELEAA